MSNGQEAKSLLPLKGSRQQVIGSRSGTMGKMQWAIGHACGDTDRGGAARVLLGHKAPVSHQEHPHPL